MIDSQPLCRDGHDGHCGINIRDEQWEAVRLGESVNTWPRRLCKLFSRWKRQSRIMTILKQSGLQIRSLWVVRNVLKMG